MQRAALQARNQLFDFFSRLLSTLRQAAHFIGHDGKAASRFARPCRFNGCVERQQVSLLGHGFDHVQHATDFVAFAFEMAHGLGGIADFHRQFLDLGDGFPHDLVAFTRLLVGGDSRFGRFFGIARHFLHGGGHFMHRGGHLVSFDLLAVDPGAGLFRHG